jgi:hypothetical protein
MNLQEMMGALADMGAAGRLARGGRGAGRGRVTRPTPIRAKPAIITATAGVPPVANKKIYLGLGSVTFTSLTPQFQSLVGNTFVPFRGGRMTLEVLRSAGAAAIGVAIVALLVGNVPQNAGTGTAPASNWGPLATNQTMEITGAGPGIPITVQLATSATPAALESVTVGGDIKGNGIGQ